MCIIVRENMAANRQLYVLVVAVICKLAWLEGGIYSHGDESRWLSPQQTQAQRRWSVWSPARAASASSAPP